jgi:4-amino-4-deoxy-L-arabinose transferase-like glycosyltransferase
VLLTAWIGNFLFGAPVGFLAGVLMAVSLILGVEARLAKTDAALLAAVLAAQAALAKIWVESQTLSSPRKRGSTGSMDARFRGHDEKKAAWVALFWLALAVGVMLKGPIILLVVLGTILLLTISERRASWLLRLRPLWGVPLMLAVVLPWLVAIDVVSDGKFFSEAVGQNLLGKVAAGQESHGAPPGYFLALFPATFWPGSLFAALAIPFAWRRRRTQAVRFCLARPGRAAAEHLLRDPACGLALVGAEERDRFLALMRAQDAEPREVDRIGGLNYSNGRRLDLTLYAAR